MKQLAVISGKGGTGKTSVTACLAWLARPVVSADCDVDAANLGLLLPGEDRPAQPFLGDARATVIAESCIACGACEAVCRYGAIRIRDDGIAEVIRLHCEGCRACSYACPVEAVQMTPNQAGTFSVRATRSGPLVHARLGIAESNSGKLVAKVREVARSEAEAQGLGLILIDGPPGTGCPVHAAVTAVDLVLIVTEPTVAGEHDLARALALCEEFKLPVALVLNKHDLSPLLGRRIARLAAEREVPLLGQLPFDPEVPRALARGELPLSVPGFAGELERIWEGLRARLEESEPGKVTRGGSR